MDDYRRTPGIEVLTNGCKAPEIGIVYMDQCIIVLDGLPNPQVGDEVVLIGTQGDNELTANHLAQN